ncbi:FxLYD domain-containing protein [Anaeroarcus burkinensis]|uniref:FxLYD domain-containing protein n=1 Tax=Anaeroarcus burkinensis TaxID=82376 RepID=UPI0003F61D4B|nr:FxLYD domain-containing protein [Anaeroarcus burkinensis]
MRRYQKKYSQQQAAYEEAALFLRSLEMLLWTMAAVLAVWLSYRVGLQHVDWLWLLFAAPFGVVMLVIRGLQYLHKRMFQTQEAEETYPLSPSGYLRPDEQGTVYDEAGRRLLLLTGHSLVGTGDERILRVDVGNQSGRMLEGVLLRALLYDRQEQLLGVVTAVGPKLEIGDVWQAEAPVKAQQAVRAVLCFHVQQYV